MALDIVSLVGKVLGSDKIKGKILDLFKGQKTKQREFELELQKMIAVDLQREYNDLDNARQMQIAALKQNDRFAKRYVYYLTSFLVLTTVSSVFVLLWVEIPENNEQLIYTGFGALWTITSQRIMNFFYGKTNDKNNNK